MNITYGGRTHACDPLVLAVKPGRMTPLCGRSAKRARPSMTSKKVDCVSCLTRQGQDIPDGARKRRIVWGERSGFGWTIVSKGKYEAEVPDTLGVYRRWILERVNGVWYLSGPQGQAYGPMRGTDGDRRLKAAIDAASPHIVHYVYQG